MGLDRVQVGKKIAKTRILLDFSLDLMYTYVWYRNLTSISVMCTVLGNRALITKKLFHFEEHYDNVELKKIFFCDFIRIKINTWIFFLGFRTQFFFLVRKIKSMQHSNVNEILLGLTEKVNLRFLPIPRKNCRLI